MSDFKVIKCKNCDAGLTLLSSQKLHSCVQCGHNFSFINKKEERLHSVNDLFQQSEDALGISDAKVTSTQLQSLPELRALIGKLSKDKSARATTKKQKKIKSVTTGALPKKGKGLTIGTIIFWGVMFNIIKGILGR